MTMHLKPVVPVQVKNSINQTFKGSMITAAIALSHLLLLTQLHPQCQCITLCRK